MTCKHLHQLEDELLTKNIRETYRGQPWSKNCREWVYFDCVFTNLEKTIDRLGLDRRCVKIHSLLGTHEGQEHGLLCQQCHDAIMGLHPEGAKLGGKKFLEFE